MKRLRQKISNESGAILMSSTMGIFILLSIFAFYLARFASTENQTGGYYALDIKARNLALTGIEHGLHVYASSKSTESFTKKFNNGNYTVSFDDEKDEVGDQLSKIQYTMITSKAKISDTERKVRLLISTFPEAFS